MEITIKEGCTGALIEGVCSDEIKRSSGNTIAIRFGFFWDKEAKDFTKLYDGKIEDSFGLVATFSKAQL